MSRFAGRAVSFEEDGATNFHVLITRETVGPQQVLFDEAKATFPVSSWTRS